MAMAAADHQPQTTGQGHHRGGPVAPRPAVGRQAAPNNGGQLGCTYTIYRFFDADHRLLYLGESGQVRQRIVDLESGGKRGLPLGYSDGPRPWWREAVRIELQHLPPGTTEAEAQAEAARQVEIERPIYNSDRSGTIDLARQQRVLDLAHFEVDVAPSSTSVTTESFGT